jgi:hypothetical protein
MKAHGVISPHLQTEEPELDNPLAKKMLAMDRSRRRWLSRGVETIRDHHEQAQRGIANYFVLMTPFGDMTYDEASFTIDAVIDEVIRRSASSRPRAQGLRTTRLGERSR